MVFITLTQQDGLIIADCHKGTKNGEYFQLVIDSVSKECISSPEKKILTFPLLILESTIC